MDRNGKGSLSRREFMGVSALARDYAATGDKETQAKLFRLVRGYAETITPKSYAGYPLPCYTFDKINCGLIGALRFSKDPSVLPALAHAVDTVMPRLPQHES